MKWFDGSTLADQTHQLNTNGQIKFSVFAFDFHVMVFSLNIMFQSFLIDLSEM